MTNMLCSLMYGWTDGHKEKQSHTGAPLLKMQKLLTKIPYFVIYIITYGRTHQVNVEDLRS